MESGIVMKRSDMIRTELKRIELNLFRIRSQRAEVEGGGEQIRREVERGDMPYTSAPRRRKTKRVAGKS